MTLLRLIRTHLAQLILEVVLVVLCVVLSFTAPNFLTVDNLLNVARAVALNGIVAFGMTMVIIAGEIDLSVASTIAFSGCLAAFLVKHHVPVTAALVITLAAGGTLGALTGAIRCKYNVPSFIITLALLTGLRGAALMLSGGFALTPFPDWYYFLGGGYVGPIPVAAIMFAVVFLVIHFILGYTVFGRTIYAVGANAEATRLSGININRVRIGVLAITGALAALSGILLSSRMMSGDPNVAQGWELDIISAVIIGGASLSGGQGTVWGTLVGVTFIGVIANGLTLLNVPPYGQYVIRGLLILGAVTVMQHQQRKRD